MKKVISLILCVILVGSLAACSKQEKPQEPVQSTAAKADTKKVYRILSGSSESSTTYKVLKELAERYKNEVNPDFEFEAEIITSTNDLWQKLNMYITANNVPDIFSISNGLISAELIVRGELVNMTEELQKLGVYDNVNVAMKDFFRSNDGNMYMIPSGFNGEFFVYRTSTFEKYNLTPPATWEEFLNTCQILKDNGEIPYVMRGADSVMYLRFLAFPSWTTEGDSFIKELLAGETSFSESETGQYSAQLLYELGTGGYFIPGYNNLTLSDVVDTFLSGQGTMCYASTAFVGKLSDLYEQGEIGFFIIPQVEGKAANGASIPTHGGKGWGINKKSYDEDPVLQDFFKYFIEHVDEEFFKNGEISWMDTDVPEGQLSKLMNDLGKQMQEQPIAWVSWDDKMQPATLTTAGDAAQELVNDMITPEEFAQKLDEAIKANGG